MRDFARRWWGPAAWGGVLVWFGSTLWQERNAVTYLVLFLGLGLIAVGAEGWSLHRLRRTGRTDDEWVAEVRGRQSRIMAMVVTFGSLVAVAGAIALIR